MRINNTYQYRIKLFIILLAVLAQTFLFLTISASYINSKISAYNDVKEGQQRYYCNELDTLCVKLDNLLYLFENSGAVKFCSDNRIFADFGKTSAQYENIKSILNNSVLADRYFSGYYLIGKNINQYSFSKLDGSFSELGSLNLEYSALINDYNVNSFTKNYQRLFIFKKEDFSGINVSPEMKAAYEKMLDSLDGEIVYLTVRNDVLCIVIVNRQFLDTVFEDISVTDTSAAIANPHGEIIYSRSYDGGEFISIAENLSGKYFTYTGGMYTLITDSDIHYTAVDICFIGLMLLCCVLIVLWAFHIAVVYSDKIMEPYRILRGFFNLNNSAEEIEELDYLNFGRTSKKRSDISKNILTAFMLAILLPTAVSSALYLTALNITSDCFIKNKTTCSHMHLVQKFYDNFDFYISSTCSYSNSSEDSGEVSRLKYTVTLDNNFSLDSQPFESLNYTSSSAFNKQLRAIKNTASENGTLIYIDSDLFGDHALGSVYKTDDGTYLLTVFKSETIGSVIPENDTEFMLIDLNGNTVAQNAYIKPGDKEKIIGGSRSKFVYKKDFPDFGWTLYSFSDPAKIKNGIYATVTLDLIAILVFLLAILIAAWIYSTRFMRPLERIENSMSSEEPEHTVITETNEIEEVLNVYNKMVRHIQQITDDKINLVREEEKVNALKIKAELNALQQQINPHFLYNTLEMINLNVLKLGDINTSKVIGKLSKIFRYAVSSATETVYLFEEIENTQNYMSVWDVRFPGRYEFSWDIDEDTKNLKSLKLILQPITENCFFHAFNDMTSHCSIKISTFMEGDFIVINIADNGCGIEQKTLDEIYKKFSSKNLDLTGKGIGICNVYRRLKLFYGDSADITIQSKVGRGTNIQIRFIPKKGSE